MTIDIEFVDDYPQTYKEEDIPLYRVEPFQVAQVPVPLIEELENHATKWCDTRMINFNDLLKVDMLKGFVNAIISITGDDEILTTNCQSLPPMHFVAGGILSGIKLSEKDTGISQRKGNYTEGWILLAPNRESTFDSVNRRHVNDGVPFVLDTPKLKQASAVRKQSTIGDENLESKFRDLYKFSKWVNQNWLTYDLAQMNLVLATAIFDFKDSNSFPFMYGTEGGCGGKPPWNNLETVVSALHFYKKGRNQELLLGLMNESTLIQEGKVKPKDAYLLQAMHYVQAGNSTATKLVEVSNLMKKVDNSAHQTIMDACKGVNPLPDSLISKSITVECENKLIGSTISELRRNGLVMTEHDIRLKSFSEDKFIALLGNKSMDLVKQDNESSNKKLKLESQKVLKSMGKQEAKTFCLNPRETLQRYYQTRENRDDISALTYAGEVRVFKTSDVLTEFQTQGQGLNDDVIQSLKASLETERYTHHKKVVRDFQLSWLEENDLFALITEELPPGFGPDDARIAKRLARLEKDNPQPFSFVVVTNDAAMVEALQAMKRDNVSIQKYSRERYLIDCQGQPVARSEKYSVPHFDGTKFVKSVFLEECLENEDFFISFDYPNIERAMESYQLQCGYYSRNIGGYLKCSTLKERVGWAETPWSQLIQLKDFSVKTTRLRG